MRNDSVRSSPPETRQVTKVVRGSLFVRSYLIQYFSLSNPTCTRTRNVSRLPLSHRRRFKLHVNPVRVKKSVSSHELTAFISFADVDTETSVSDLEQTNRIVTYTTATTQVATQVEERKSTINVQTTEKSTARAEPPRRDLSIASLGGVQGKAASHHETYLPIVSSTSMAVETRRYSPPSVSTSTTVEDSLVEIQQLHRQQTEYMINVMRDRLEEHEQYTLAIEEQFEATRMENEDLLQQVSTLTYKMKLLEIQLRSYDEPPSPDNTITTVTTTITTTITTVTTVTTQIENWRDASIQNEGSITITRTELDELLSNLFDTSSQMATLQDQYTSLSKTFDSVRRELQVASSLNEEKDAKIASLTAEVEELKRLTGKSEQPDFERQEQFQQDLATSTSQITEFQERYAVRTAEMASLSRQIQSTVSRLTQSDAVQPSYSSAQADRIAAVRRDTEQLRQVSSELQSEQPTLEKIHRQLIGIQLFTKAKRPDPVIYNRKVPKINASLEKETQTAELDQGHVTAISQYNDLQKSHEALSRKVNALLVELSANTSRYEGTISALTVQVNQSRATDTEKTKQLAVSGNQARGLQLKVSALVAQFTELQGRYETQSEELTSVQSKLEITISSNAKNCRDLTELIARLRSNIGLGDKRLATALKQAEDLRLELATSNSRIAELQQDNQMQSIELDSLREQVEALVSGVNGTTALVAQVEELKRSCATRSKELTTASRNIDQLRQELYNSSSQIAELQKQLSSNTKRHQKLLAAKTAELTVEIQRWEQTDAAKSSELSTARAEMEQLRVDLSASSTQMKQYRVQIRELTVQIQRWEQTDAAKSSELSAARTEMEQLHVDQSTQMKQYRVQIKELTVQIRHWEQTDAAKSSELSAARAEMEQLHVDQSTQMKQYRVQIKELTVQIQRWEQTDAAKSLELRGARAEMEQLRVDLSTSSTQMKQYRAQIRELTVQIRHWEQTDAAKSSELSAAHAEMEQLRVDLSTSFTQMKQYRVQIRELTVQIQRKQKCITKPAELSTADALELQPLRTENEQSELPVVPPQGRSSHHSRTRCCPSLGFLGGSGR